MINFIRKYFLKFTVITINGLLIATGVAVVKNNKEKNDQILANNSAADSQKTITENIPSQTIEPAAQNDATKNTSTKTNTGIKTPTSSTASVKPTNTVSKSTAPSAASSKTTAKTVSTPKVSAPSPAPTPAPAPAPAPAPTKKTKTS